MSVDPVPNHENASQLDGQTVSLGYKDQSMFTKLLLVILTISILKFSEIRLWL